MEERRANMEDWKKDWRPMMDAVGLDFSDGEKTWGADPVEKGAIRRFLEPLEFDCPFIMTRLSPTNMVTRM
ncbi:hypothetical protein [Salicibibacter cibarius]|uniref:hypothetical protein n=1 Tax=Salicibibacter cibarius TaxID=2743000 RepID=UPI001904C978|nr:hypothetical protein [Salicibibacter cibarius]